MEAKTELKILKEIEALERFKCLVLLSNNNDEYGYLNSLEAVKYAKENTLCFKEKDAKTYFKCKEIIDLFKPLDILHLIIETTKI